MARERKGPPSKKVKIQEPQSDSDLEDSDGELVEQTSSQLSLTSEHSKDIDDDVMAVLQKQLLKKREERQKKILASIEKHLQQENTKTATEIKDIIQKVNEIHAKFLLDYAACEDRIRKKWARIYKEQESLEKFMQGREKPEAESYEAAWEGTVAGLSRIQTSCKDFKTITKELDNECSDLKVK